MFDLEITVRIVGAPSDQQFESFFDTVSDAFFELEALADHDVSANLENRTLTFGMLIEAGDEVAALSTGLAAVRAAIHTANGHTGGWESEVETLQTLIALELSA